MKLWFIEVLFDDIWTPVGSGHATKDKALWAIGQWRQRYICYRDDPFRAREHEVSEPWDEEDRAILAPLEREEPPDTPHIYPPNDNIPF